MNRVGRRVLALVALAVAGAATSFSTVALADGSFSYELREEITGVLLPSRAFAVTDGTCATGSGTAPISLYAQGASGGGAGLGAGLGARAGYHYVHLPSTPTDHTLTWWGLRVQAGADLNVLYAKIATGVTDVSGRLCARVNDGVELQYRGSAVLLAQIPLALGAELGLGTTGEDASLHGVVLGAAWAPALTYLKPWIGGGELSVHELGAELTVDFVTLRPGSERSHAYRIAAYFVLPVQDDDVFFATVSFGVVWY